jgi:hypothetical protein
LRREAQKRNKQNIIDAFGERVKNTPPNFKKKKNFSKNIFSTFHILLFVSPLAKRQHGLEIFFL